VAQPGGRLSLARVFGRARVGRAPRLVDLALQRGDGLRQLIDGLLSCRDVGVQRDASRPFGLDRLFELRALTPGCLCGGWALGGRPHRGACLLQFAGPAGAGRARLLRRGLRLVDLVAQPLDRLAFARECGPRLVALPRRLRRRRGGVLLGIELCFDHRPRGRGFRFGRGGARQVEDQLRKRRARIWMRQRRLEGGQTRVELGAQRLELPRRLGGQIIS